MSPLHLAAERDMNIAISLEAGVKPDTCTLRHYDIFHVPLIYDYVQMGPVI